MLTAEHVRVQRQGNALRLRPLDAATRARARRWARFYLDAATQSLGQTRSSFDARCQAALISHRDRRVAAGLLKLVQDRCNFDVQSAHDPALVRQTLFTAASQARASLGETDSFDREALLQQVGESLAMTPEELTASLFADLRQSQRLNHIEPIDDEGLVALYELGQVQAILLRAVKVHVRLEHANPAFYRLLFRKLKFLRLLFRIDKIEHGYQLIIDGPYSLFSAVTKYGLQLALLMPCIRQCPQWSIHAWLCWGKNRERLEFKHQGEATHARFLDTPEQLPDEVNALLAQFNTDDQPWQAAPATTLLHMPGLGECIPDLVFTHRQSQTRIYFEVLGYWHRESVWKRLALAEKGLPAPILFAVPMRLRVSEEVLDESSLPAAIYTYKGVMNRKRIVAKLDALHAHQQGTAHA